MATSALDPLRIPADLWDRDDVCRALDRRDIGALFRLLRRYAGASQHRIGTATELQQGTVCKVMNGERTVTSIDVLERIADGLHMPDHARLWLGLAPKEDAMRRRTALGLGLMAALSPQSLTDVLRDSAAEALEFTRERATSSVGAGTLDHLAAVVAELDRAYQWKPATELFPIARAYRQRVAQLIEGRHTLKEARELYVNAAWLSELLAGLAHDLASPMAEEAYAIDCYRHADQAGHDELCGWAAEAVSEAALYTGRPGKAIDAAMKGLDKVSDRHPVAARLRAKAARAHARQGNRESCVELLADAREVCDRLPDQTPSRLSTMSAEYTSYTVADIAGHCHVWLADWKAAEQHSRTALAVVAWSPGRAERSRVNLATALAHFGSPDEAAELGGKALASGHWPVAVLRQARELDAALTNRYPKQPRVQEFHDQYQQLAGRAQTN
jgi:transcriptional regulator with XRE-family HTH domain